MECFRPVKQGIGRIIRQTTSVFLFLCLLPAPVVLAVQTAARPAEIAPAFPRELGEVIFHAPGEEGKHLYIIGHSHRSALSGANGNHTVRAQAEVFRIGELLIRQENIRLLLPEGFFKKNPSVAIQKVAYSDLAGLTLDNQTLEAKLSDTNVFINADILLKSSFPIQLQQVEDSEIYRSVGQALRLASQADSTTAPLVDMELSYLQEIRSAAMLQNAPAAIEREFELGNIENRRAIFTIGMAHVDEIVRFLQDGRIEVKAPSLPNYQDLNAVLELVRQGYGVTVILPRTLMDDQEIMRMANLSSI
jgi:hypothetical protein